VELAAAAAVQPTGLKDAAM
jgi:hypothetical protein